MVLCEACAAQASFEFDPIGVKLEDLTACKGEDALATYIEPGLKTRTSYFSPSARCIKLYTKEIKRDKKGKLIKVIAVKRGVIQISEGHNSKYTATLKIKDTSVMVQPYATWESDETYIQPGFAAKTLAKHVFSNLNADPVNDTIYVN